MKPLPISAWIAGGSILLVFVALAAQSPVPQASPTKSFMRQKLDHSQRVLEGITTENFNLTAIHAKRLGAMSLEAAWRVLDNPEYASRSTEFTRHVNDLVKAAENRNIDGATLAYVKMTLSCVECHKYVRGRQTAQLFRTGFCPGA